MERYYYIKDHLGSIRVTTDETGTVVSAQDYFAYGELLREFNSVERYKFTEKERDTETEYDYFGARYYDSRIGRWMQVDPLSEKYFGWSPYNYSLNNPVNFFDSDGRGVDPKTKLTTWKDVSNTWNQAITESANAPLMERAGMFIIGVFKTLGTAIDATDPIGVFGMVNAISIETKALTSLTKSVTEIKVTEEIGSESAKVFMKIDETTKHLTPKDITGAMGDLSGQPITIGGKTSQHLEEVRNAQRGLVNQIEKLKTMLGNKNLKDQARVQIEQKLGATSKLLDETEKYIPRIK